MPTATALESRSLCAVSVVETLAGIYRRNISEGPA